MPVPTAVERICTLTTSLIELPSAEGLDWYDEQYLRTDTHNDALFYLLGALRGAAGNTDRPMTAQRVADCVELAVTDALTNRAKKLARLTARRSPSPISPVGDRS